MDAWTIWAPGDGHGWRFELHEALTLGVAIECELFVAPGGRTCLVWFLSSNGERLVRTFAGAS